MAGSKGKGPYKVLCGTCPDPQCKTKLFFPAHDSSIECTACGQRHERKSITEVAEVTNPQVALHNILKNILIGNTKPKKGTDSVKVLGLSNYQCKLVSPLLTKYGMDKHTGKAVLLKNMGQSGHFDCGILSDRAFLIEQEHIDIVGYGRDRTGSMRYLKATLDAIKQANNGEETLIPIHADGDGHCLVHAVSRALVGRELFWHALRENLKSHLTSSIEKYKLLFQDFVDTNEWEIIIQECDPDFTPCDGEPLGLRNIHIFGLANLLKRPIVLLDSVSGLQSSGDYSGIFLPGLVSPEKCCAKDGRPNKPLCLAWSSSGRNHYITLVGVKGRPLPKLPAWMLPKVWGMPQELVNQYVEFDSDGCCVIGGDKCLQEKYILRLVRAMEDVFHEEYGVSPTLVSDVHQFLYKSTGMVGVKMDAVIDEARQATSESRLYRCQTCEAIVEFHVAPEWLRPGGVLHKLALKTHGTLSSEKNYNFTYQGLVCTYDAENDTLVPDMARSRLTSCSWCQGTTMRLVRGDGSAVYQNGDKTLTKSESSRCTCGYKHYWDGKEYDNLPEVFPISLEWGGKVIAEKVFWFQYESDVTLNSNVFEVAQGLVQKHFPGEFGSERLVQKVVDTILRITASKEAAKEGAKDGAKDGGESSKGAEGGSEEKKEGEWKDDTASKIILTGFKSKTMHKEELNMSEAEKALRKKVEQKAQQQQKRKTSEHPAVGKASSKGGPTKTTTKVQKKDSDALKSPASPSPASPPVVPSPTKVQSPAAQSPPPTGKKIRVTTSDGRQLMLSLEKDTTYTALQGILEKELGVAPGRQRIRCGFPPKELKPPGEGKEGEPVSLQHGDRVTVEVLPDPNEVVVAMDTNQGSSESTVNRSQAAEDLIKGLNSLQQSAEGDSLDTSISALTLMATMMGREVWTYVQAMPNLFRAGGLFYEQVKRDLGLEENKHARLPAIPGKVFRYNKSTDEVELCMEPLGHFSVGPDIDDRIAQAKSAAGGASASRSGGDSAHPSSVLSNSSASSTSSFHTLSELSGDMKKVLGSGGTGVAVNQPMKWPGGGHVAAFSGRGHTLSGVGGATEMNIGPGSPRHKPMDIDSDEDAALFNPDSKLDTMEVDANKPSTSQKDSTMFERVGPGYTRLNATKTNDVNAQSEMFQTIASSIQAALLENPEEKMSDVDNAPETDELHIADCEEDLASQDVQVTSPPAMDNDASNNNAQVNSTIVNSVPVEIPAGTKSTGNLDAEMEQSNVSISANSPNSEDKTE